MWICYSVDEVLRIKDIGPVFDNQKKADEWIRRENNTDTAIGFYIKFKHPRFYFKEVEVR